MYHTNVNVNWIVKNLIQNKTGIRVNVGASVKIKQNIVLVKKIIFWILQHVFVKMVNMEEGQLKNNHHVITRDDIIEETITVPTNLNEKRQP